MPCLSIGGTKTPTGVMDLWMPVRTFQASVRRHFRSPPAGELPAASAGRFGERRAFYKFILTRQAARPLLPRLPQTDPDRLVQMGRPLGRWTT